tara:strand:+ start:1357 stop:2064 length:708 start_codon:yes stop_codon:yes gene_type:complete
MGSLGGLDVAYGSQMQLVRTNVLVVETDGTTTKAMAEMVHSIAAQKYPAALRPDFTAFVASGALTEGYATVLTNQVEGNVLKDITAVPMAGSSFKVSTTVAGDKGSRGMSYEAILNVGIAQINANDTMTVDDLFADASGTTAGENVGEGEQFLASDLQSQLMKAQFESDQTAFAGNHGVQTLNLTGLLTDSGVLGGTAVTSAMDSLTESTTAAELNDAIAGAGAMVSILAIGRTF